MATTTTNLSLIKPDGTDKIRINQLNQNFDILDRVVGPVGNTSLQAQVNPIAAKVTYLDKLIENGTDLNSLMNTGVYRSPNVAAGVNTLLNCPVEVPFVMVVSGTGELTGCVQLLCSGTQLYCRRATSSGFPESWSSPTGGEGGGGSESEYTIDDLYEAIDTAMAGTKAEIVSELIDDTTGAGDTDATWSSDKIATTIATMQALLDTAAHVDGEYDDFVAGNAKQLVSKVAVEEKVPYNFRTAGGAADIGDRLNDKLIGGTIVWNRLIQATSYSKSTGVTASIDENEVATFTCSGEAQQFYYPFTQRNGRIYLGSITLKMSTASNDIPVRAFSADFATSATTDWQTVWFVKKAWANSGASIGVIDRRTSDWDSIQVKNPMIIDLVAMFGPTIANHIYNLESATSGAGVAWFRKYFPKPYYAYNAGELMSVQAASHNTVGFNQWDEEWELGGIDYETGIPDSTTNKIRSKNFIRIVPNTTYHCFSGGEGTISARFYDANKNFIGTTGGSIQNQTFATPENAMYMKFATSTGYGTTYKNNICINLHWDGERDGEYEPYSKHEYALGNVELRGVPKLDANNNLYYDGDIYEANGTVTRKYGVVDLGTLTWTRSQSDSSHFYANVKNVIDYKFADDAQLVCRKYIFDTYGASLQSSDHYYYGAEGTIRYYYSPTSALTSRELYICDSGTYANAAAFKSALSGVYLVYELATPTTETSDPFQDPQVVDDFGTEEYVDRGVTATTPTRDVSIPVGHETKYQVNLRAKLEMAPNSPAFGDGDYVVRQVSGQNEYVKWENSRIAEALARKDGDYDELVAGTSKQLASNVGVLNKEPYNFRTAGGSADIGDRMVDKLIGGTICWNQFVPDNWIHHTSSSENAWGALTNSRAGYGFSLVSGHKYLSMLTGKTVSNGQIGIRDPSNSIIFRPNTGYFIVYEASVNTNATTFIQGSWGEGTTDAYFNFFDLTQMFGSTIANYIYSLEQATAGAGVAWFRKLFPKPDYAYNAGELMSVQAASHDTVGFNAWDEEWEVGGISSSTGLNDTSTDRIRSKNYIRVLPNTTYYFKSPKLLGLRYYDADKKFLSFTTVLNGTNTTPTNCHYLRFIELETTTYGNNVCINLHWDGERDGEYEPYVKRSYPLGNVELRGIPMLDSNNNIYYDGDTYESDGTVTRKYGIVDLGTINWKVTEDWGITGVPVYTPASASDRPSPLPKGSADLASLSNAIMAGFDRMSRNVLYGTSGVNAFNITNMGDIQIRTKTSYESVEAFKAAMSGVYLVYEVATPTTESSDLFQNPQIVDDWGTEAYVDREAEYIDPEAEVFMGFVRDVSIPVGHETVYQPNLRAKLEMSPDSPNGDGDYIIRQSNGENAYVPLVIPAELPTAPNEDGTYILKVTVSSGTPTLSWVQST